MNARIFLRVARGGRKGFRVSASAEPNHEPISSSGGYGRPEFFPTVSFAVDFEVPDALFKQAEIPVAKINVALKDAVIEGSILIPAIKSAIAKAKKAK